MNKFEGIKLWHSFRALDGSTIPGMVSFGTQDHIASLIPSDLTGKSVLDIGAFDGYYSFICEERHAERVVAIDSEEHLLAYEAMGVHHPDGAVGFRTVKETLFPNTKVEYYCMSVYDVEKLNAKFDLVLFLGVYYHTQHPLLAFQKCRAVTGGSILVEGLVNGKSDTSMDFVEGREMNNDPTNWWSPSLPCLLAMMRVSGFKDIQVIEPGGRPIIRASV